MADVVVALVVPVLPLGETFAMIAAGGVTAGGADP